MPQYHSLKRELTKTVLLWSTVFFALLTLLFLLTFHKLELSVLEIMANHRLAYQTQEFAKHLDQRDQHAIREESNALTQDDNISAMLLIDTSGQLVYASLSTDHATALEVNKPVTISSLQQVVDQNNHLHLFARTIPRHAATLALIMDNRPVEYAILTATGWTVLLMLTLLFLSIKALHLSLKRNLVTPVEQVRSAMRDHTADENTIRMLKQTLPTETADILAVFDHLQHSRTDMQTHISSMMNHMASCFWQSDDGIHYSAVSGKSDDILHADATELAGQPLWTWIGSDEQAAMNYRQLQHAIERHQSRLDIAYQLGNPDLPSWYGESITISYDADDKIDGIYGLINDISARKHDQLQQEKALEIRHRLQATSTLVGGIAHEFNNALAGMNGNLFLIKQTSKDAQNSQRIERIEQLIDRSATMIDRMLAFSRQSMVNQSAINLSEFMKNLHAGYAIKHPGANTVSFALHDQPVDAMPIIFANEQKLHEVLLEVIANAEQATSQCTEPVIEIKLNAIEADEAFLASHPCLSSRDIVDLSISDNGCGIPLDIQKRIYEPFFTTREVGQGTGLGLSMVYGYIHQIGGDIDFYSATDNGTTFHIYLPVMANPETERSAESEQYKPGNGETVLLVDDDKMVRETTRSVLDRMGYHVITAKTGEEGVALFKQHQADIRVVFMDIIMPGIDGIEATRRIRKITTDMPVIFITGYDRTQPLEAEVYAEHTQLINKPFHVSTLNQAIQTALQPQVAGQ